MQSKVSIDCVLEATMQSKVLIDCILEGTMQSKDLIDCMIEATMQSILGRKLEISLKSNFFFSEAKIFCQDTAKVLF